MNTEKLSHWLTISGNLGLIAGLILVAVQINQNTDIARTEMVSRDFEFAMMFGLKMIGENPAGVWSKAALDPESLTDEELTRLQFMVDFWWNFHDRLDYLEQNDMVDENWTDGLEYHAAHTYGGSRAAAAIWNYWLNSQSAGRDGAWKEIVKARFPEHPDGNARMLESIRHTMREDKMGATK